MERVLHSIGGAGLHIWSWSGWKWGRRLEWSSHRTMLNDAFIYEEDNPVHGPTVNAETFYNMLQPAKQSLYEECSFHSELSTAMRSLSMKTEHNISYWCLNDVLHLMQETTLTPNWIPQGFEAVKKKVKELWVDYKIIHCCRNGCMIYYMEDVHLLACKFCGSERFQNSNGHYKGSPIAKMHYIPLILRL